MQFSLEYVVTDPEFYAPLEHLRDRDEQLMPGSTPPDWTDTASGVWRQWYRPGHADLVEDGWKVHVSARPDRLRHVLDTVAPVCFERHVTFKHLATPKLYWWTHQKYASRSQSGKFIAAYPRDVEVARDLMEALREALRGEDGPYILTDRRYRGSKTVYYRYGAFVTRLARQADGTRVLIMRDHRGRLVPDERGVSFHLPPGLADPFAGGAGADNADAHVAALESMAADVTAHRAGTLDLATPDIAARHVAAHDVAARDIATGTTGSGASAPDDFVPGGSGWLDQRALSFNGFVIDSSVMFTNAGGTYRAHEIATGRPVFVKEARPHTGLRDDNATAIEQLREEWATLSEIHALAPGLAPEPIAYFGAWEHEFMAVEHIEGRTLGSWMAVHHPLLRPGTTDDDFAAFYDRCEKIISAIEATLAHLHDVGYVFVDISPSNMILDDDDSIRLIDFGSAHRLDSAFTPAATPGFTPPDGLVGTDQAIYDHFGVSRLAQHFLGPMQMMIDIDPGVVPHIYRDLSDRAPVPPGLWRRATRYQAPGKTARATPEEVAADPVKHLTELRDGVADAIIAMTDLGNPERVFPTIAAGYGSNTVGIAYGTAGVIHALSRAGRSLPDGLLDRLRRDALGRLDDLPPGLYIGSAGIAQVLAAHGLLDEARTVLGAASRHPLTRESATLFGGSAGVALGHLALYRDTGDEYHVDRAVALAAALPGDDELAPALGANDAIGLMHGRAGVALVLQQLAGVTGDRGYLSRAAGLLHSELGRASEIDSTGLLFPVSEKDRRAMPYLYAGSAGIAYAASRCLQDLPDERLAEAMPRLLTPLHLMYTLQPGLFQGLAGYSFTLSDHAARTGDEALRQTSVRLAQALFKYALPHRTGIRFLGDQLLRYSAELWSGSSGVLLALTQVLDPRPDPLFTVDAFIGGLRGTTRKAAL